MKKLILLLLIFLLIPLVNAEELECGITNLAYCLPQKLLEYSISISNAPIEFLLGQIHKYLTEPVNIESLKSSWQLIVYILSIFYGLFLLFAGYNFIVSGHDVIRRESAKEWLKNTVFVIVFIQASYFLYKILVDIGSALSSGVMSMINPSFFSLAPESLPDIGLHFLLNTSYLFTLFFTLLFLMIRYFLVNLGLILFPIGFFLFFIPPLKSYGKLIIEGLIVLILIPFFFTLVLLMGSKLMVIPIANHFNILVMLACFTIINIGMIFLILFVILKVLNNFEGVGGRIVSVIKYIAV